MHDGEHITAEGEPSKGEARFMRRALRLASFGLGRTHPNPMVGAVLVKEGRIIGEGFHAESGAPHAEILALSHAKEAARGADLYVTLEPCAHHGKTPPCTTALIEAGIARVFAACKDPNPLAAGGAQLLSQAGISVHFGMLAHLSRIQNRAWFKAIEQKTPYLAVKFAQTLDGALSIPGKRWITQDKARLHAHRLRQWADAMIVGKHTILQDNPQLTTRLLPQNLRVNNKIFTLKGRDPVCIIMDRFLDCVDSSVQVFTTTPERCIFACSPDAPSEKCKRARDAGARLWRKNDGYGSVSQQILLQDLYADGFYSLMIEGGPSLLSSFINHSSIDEMHAYVSPSFAAGDSREKRVHLDMPRNGSNPSPDFVNAGFHFVKSGCINGDGWLCARRN